MSKIETLNRIFVNANNACLKGAFTLTEARQVMNDIEDLSNFIQAVETVQPSQTVQPDQTETMISHQIGDGWNETTTTDENVVAGTGDKVAKRRR